MNIDFKTEYLVKELLIIIVAAIIPIIVAHLLGGEELVAEILRSFIANSSILYYSMACSVIFVVFAYLDSRFQFRNASIEKTNNHLTDILFESSGTLIGILRLAAGIFISCGVHWFVFDFNVDQLLEILCIFAVGVIAMLETAYLSKCLEYIKNNWMKKISNNDINFELRR